MTDILLCISVIILCIFVTLIVLAIAKVEKRLDRLEGID